LFADWETYRKIKILNLVNLKWYIIRISFERVLRDIQKNLLLIIPIVKSRRAWNWWKNKKDVNGTKFTGWNGPSLKHRGALFISVEICVGNFASWNTTNNVLHCVMLNYWTKLKLVSNTFFLFVFYTNYASSSPDCPRQSFMSKVREVQVVFWFFLSTRR
jgi:hypothetical protein